MAERTNISWCDMTFNHVMGCTKVSPACKNCYAERDMDHRYGKVAWGPQGTRVLTSDANWKKPLKWDRDAAIGPRCMKCDHDGCYDHDANKWDCPQCGAVLDRHRPRVFCASLADVFEDWDGLILDHKGKVLPNVTMDGVRARLFRLIDDTPNLDWLLLTKRPENVPRMWPDLTGSWEDSAPYYRENVWLGTSVENQEYADQRIPQLLRCRGLSPVLFLSCEPLLGPLDLQGIRDAERFPGCAHFDVLHGRMVHEDDGHQWTQFPKVDWVIAGGESGDKDSRPTDPSWLRTLRDQCASANVPYHFKQWGYWSPMENIRSPKGYRLLDGIEHLAFPEVDHGA